MGLCASQPKSDFNQEIENHFSQLKDTMLPMYLHLWMILKEKPEDKEMGKCIDVAKQSINDAENQISQHPGDKKMNRRIMHDMRNQISPIFGFLDILSYDIIDKERCKDIHDTMDQARKSLDVLGAFIRQDATKVESAPD